MPHILTFDLGTTNFKACIFDDAGSLLALARRPTPTVEPEPGRREITVDAFIDSLTHLIDELRRSDAAAIEAVDRISFATQTNSFVLLDAQDHPVTPIILWNDQRAADRPELIAALAGDANLRGETGLASVTHEMAAAKLRWLQAHQPDIWRRARRLCLIGDYLTWWLTGRHITEAGAAGLTGLLDIHTLTWRDAARRATGLTDITLPEARYAGSDLGTIRDDAAHVWRLSPDCRCVLGCLDQYAGAIGVGNVEPGDISETTGTVLATVAISEMFTTDLPDTVFQGPAWRPGLWWRMSFGSVSANLLEALRQAEVDAPCFDTLIAEAQAVAPGSDGVALDATASAKTGRPVYLKLRPNHTRGHRVRAVLEAVAEALRQQVDAIGGTDRPIRAAGGAARSALWRDIKSQALGVPVIATDCPEPTSLGAARLAMLDDNRGRG